MSAFDDAVNAAWQYAQKVGSQVGRAAEQTFGIGGPGTPTTTPSANATSTTAPAGTTPAQAAPAGSAAPPQVKSALSGGRSAVNIPGFPMPLVVGGPTVGGSPVGSSGAVGGAPSAPGAPQPGQTNQSQQVQANDPTGESYGIIQRIIDATQPSSIQAGGRYDPGAFLNGPGYDPGMYIGQ